MAKEPDPITKKLYIRRKNGGNVRMLAARISAIARLANVDTEVVIKYYRGLEVPLEEASKIRFYSKKYRGKQALQVVNKLPTKKRK